MTGGGGFAVNTPGGQVRLSDLPLEVLSRIEREAGVQWTTVLVAPASTALSALTVYQVCCEQTGSDPEPLTARRLIEGEIIVPVADDLPVEFEDGVPKAEADHPTPGSSGAPDDSDGPPT